MSQLENIPQFQKIYSFIQNYEDILQIVLGEFSGSIVHDDDDQMQDYYGCDFKQLRKNGFPVYMLFFNGTSNCFPALVQLNGVKWEECPIYDIDLGSNEEFYRSEGNFAQFMKNKLTEFLKHVKKLKKRSKTQRDESDNEKIESFEKVKEMLNYLDHHFTENVVFPNKVIEIPIYGENNTIKLLNCVP